MSDTHATVLVVDDEPDLADLYAAWLDGYEVRVAYGGVEALDAMDDEVDVVLLDRMMPELSGDEVLERIREAGYDVRVAMVTAVEPDFDIVEMGFDDYVVKPVYREEVRETVERLLDRASYDARLRAYYGLVSKRAALEAQKSERELADSEAYAELIDELNAVSEELDATTENFSPDDFEAELRRLDDG